VEFTSSTKLYIAELQRFRDDATFEEFWEEAMKVKERIEGDEPSSQDKVVLLEGCNRAILMYSPPPKIF